MNSTAFSLSLLIVSLLVSGSDAADAVVAPEARLKLESADEGSVRLTISNAANQVWVIEGTTDFQTWTEAGVWRVFNGSFGQTLAPAASPGRFFRAVFESGRQGVAATLENALRLPETPFNYAAPVLPASFSVNPILAQDNTPLNNLTTDAGAALGRVLFYDKRLSANQTVSCASCHQQAHGFSDPRRLSVGFNGGLTDRNSMGLSHARWYQRRRFFWDERASTLEEQVLQPIQNATEMGMTLPEVITRVSGEPFYTNLFANAFGSTTVTSNRISRALAQFVRSIVSVQTKYDLGATNNFANFTPQEELGRRIFLGQVGNATCVACHGTDNFVPGPVLNNNGLEFPYVDLGVGGVTGNPADLGKFKVPSLRNIELTAPYMHDGRFATLEQVVEFYNSGVVENPNLPPPLRNPDGTVRRLNLTFQQKGALVAFLRTLTDPSLATNPQFSDPFNYGE